MNFYPLTQTVYDSALFKTEYKAGREIGKLCLGSEALFFRSGLKIYYIPYAEIKRCFRRVMLVPAKLCCGKGALPVENLVLCDEERELAQIQLPGTQAARVLMEELKRRIPGGVFCPPEKEAEEG